MNSRTFPQGFNTKSELDSVFENGRYEQQGKFEPSYEMALAQRARRDRPRLPHGCELSYAPAMIEERFQSLFVEDLIRLFADSYNEGERERQTFSRAYGRFRLRPNSQGWERIFPRCWVRSNRLKIKDRLRNLFRVTANLSYTLRYQRLGWYLSFIERPANQPPIDLLAPGNWPKEELVDLMRNTLGEAHWNLMLQEQRSGHETRQRNRESVYLAAMIRVKRGMEALIQRLPLTVIRRMETNFHTHESFAAASGFLTSFVDRILILIGRSNATQYRPETRGHEAMQRGEMSATGGADFADSIWNSVPEEQREALFQIGWQREQGEIRVKKSLLEWQIELVKGLYQQYNYSGPVSATRVVTGSD